MDKPIKELFDKYLDGKASAAEIQMLMLHFADATHKSDLKELISGVLSEQDDSSAMQADHLDEHLELIRTNMMKDIAPRASKKWYITVFKVAAMVCIVTGLGLYLYQQGKPAAVPQMLTMANDVQPGTEKAVLTLENGEKVTLKSEFKNIYGQDVYVVKPVLGAQNGFQTISTPKGGTWQLILPDGTKVWLNAASSIKFPTNLQALQVRNVKLSGEAYFEVFSDAKRPFIVDAGGQQVQVLGTHFNIDSHGALTKTTLLEGKVKVSAGLSSVVIKPGEQVQNASLGLKVIKDVDLSEVISWKDGYFKFNGNLENVMEKIASWYDIEVVYRSKPDQNLILGGEVSRDKSLKTVLNVLQLTTDINFKIEGRRVIVMP